MQRLLAADQVSEFYIDCFAADQVAHFQKVVPPQSLGAEKTIVDVGGGCGYFALQLEKETKRKVRVIDTDPTSIRTCRESQIEAILGDALCPPIVGDEEVICFNLILHHLVSTNERLTRDLQKRSVAVWLNKARYIFVNEYIYESHIANLSGALIYWITKNRFLSAAGSAISRIAPSLRANTFGVGVRFRAHEEWVKLFSEAGFQVVARVYGKDDSFPFLRRLLMIRSIRRDSFLLVARS